MKILSSVLEKKLLFVSGKGGTGKSCLSACLAYAAALQGKKVLLVESAQQEQLAPLFGLPAFGHHETPIEGSLFGINLDATACLREYVVERLRMPRLYDKVFQNGLVKTFLETIPGLAETMILGRLQHTVVRNRYDLVIYDAPASGHFLGMMTTLDAVLASELVGPLLEQVKEVRTFLATPSICGFLLITLAEELVVNETLDFLAQLKQKSPVALSAVAINRVLQGKEESVALQALPPSPLQDFLLQNLHHNVTCQQWMQRELPTYEVSPEQTFWIPELGAFPEPLTAEFVRKFLHAILSGHAPAA